MDAKVDAKMQKAASEEIKRAWLVGQAIDTDKTEFKKLQPRTGPYEKARKALQFFEAYTEEELKKLLKQVADHKCPLGISLVDLLVTVRDKSMRAEIQRQAIEKQWSKARLKREIKDRQPPTSQGGRKLSVTSSPPEALQQLRELCMTWSRLEDGYGTFYDDRVPQTVRAKLLQVIKHVRHLQLLVDRAIDYPRE